MLHRGGFKVCLLHCVIYGLKQSHHIWCVKLSGLLTSYVFTPYKTDPFFYARDHICQFLVHVVNVDDILLTGSNKVDIVATKSYLYMHLVMHNLQTPFNFLGIEFVCQLGKSTQPYRNYALDVLQKIRLRGV